MNSPRGSFALLELEVMRCHMPGPGGQLEPSNDSYGSWREGAHDDMVLAVAIAAWWAERWQPQDDTYTPIYHQM